LKGYTLLFIFLYSLPKISAQTDTASYPYWIDMMQNEKVNFFQTQRAFELYWQNRPVEKGSGWKAFKRWEYSTYLRTDIKGNITPEATYYYNIKQWDSANAPKKSKYATQAAICFSNGLWKELGPLKYPTNNTGQPTGMGRINALAFHPKDSNILYAGAPAGGLWVSKNYGKTWECDTDTLPTLGISSIAIDANAPDTIYIGTGDRDASDASSLGVMWSKDAGKTWFSRNSGMGSLTVGRLIINPKNSAVLLAATNNGIYRSSNYGSSWTQRVGGNFKDVVFSAGSPNIVFATASGLFYKSTDNGVTWTGITSGLPTTGISRGVIAVTPADTNYVYFLETSGSVFKGMYRSTDKGNNFSTQSTTPNIMDYSNNGSGSGGQAWYDLDVAADPNNKDVVYSCGVNIFKSIIGGSTWTINAHWVGSGAPAVHADHHVMEYNPHNKNLFTGCDGGVYYTRNGGTAWNNISSGLGVSQIYKLGQSATNKNVVMNGYQDNGSARYDGSFTTVFGGDGMDCLVDFTDESVGFGEIYYGDIFRVKNNNSQGYIAGNGKNGINEGGAWVTPFVLKANDANAMFIGYKNIWRSSNVKASSTASVTWTKISNSLAGTNSNNFNFLESNIAQPNMLYAARGDAKLFKTSNANSASPVWIDLTSTLPNTATVSAIETDSKDSNVVYISQSNRIYKSTNQGASWTNITSNLPSAPYLTIVIDTSSNKEEIYVGGWAGVYYKDNTMTNWVKYSYGLPKATRVQDLEIYYSPSGKAQSHLICATYGRGNWVTPLRDTNKVPVAKFDIKDTAVCTLTSVQLTSTSENLPSVFLWQISPKSYSFAAGTDSTSENPNVVFTDKAKYSITLIAENCMGKDTTSRNLVIETYDTTRRSKCIPTTTNTGWSMGITDFKLYGQTHKSLYTKDEGPYLDLTCTKIFKLKADTFYYVNIITNPSNNEYVRGWIDFNDNGDFTDAGELVIQTPTAKTHLDTITIPTNVVLNKPLRMRIMSDFNTFSNPCATLGYGQTQDYAVYIDLPIIDAKADKDSVCAYSTVMIKDNSQGNFATYSWDFGASATPQTANGKGPHSVRFDSTGYRKISLLVNGQYSATFDSLVFVKPSPKLGYVHLPSPTGYCEGLSDSLITNDTNNLNLKYQWFKNNIPNTNKTGKLKLNNLNLSDSGFYALKGTFQGCSDTTVPFKLYVFAQPKAGFLINDTDQCIYKNSFKLTSTAKINKDSIYYFYQWGNSANSKAINPVHSYVISQKYIIKQNVFTIHNCKDSISKKVETFAQPSATYNSSAKAYCFKEQAFSFSSTASVSSGSIIKNYWNTAGVAKDSGTVFKPNYTIAGAYKIKLIAVSDNFCTDSTTILVNVYPNPVSGFTVNDTDQCVNTNQFLFTNTTSLASGTVINSLWKLGDATTSSLSGTVTKTYGVDGNFLVSLMSESDKGCKDTFEKMVYVYPKPQAAFYNLNFNQCLLGNGYNFKDSSIISSGIITSHFWNFGDNTTASLNNAAHAYLSDGTYRGYLKVTSDKGCADSVLFTSILHPSPTADFTFNLACVDDTTYFRDNSSLASGSITNYRWYLEAGDSRLTQNGSKSYKKFGSKLVSLVVTSANGCKDSISKAVTVFDKPKASFSWSLEPIGGTNTILRLFDKSLNANSWQWTDGFLNSGSGANVDFNYTDSASVWVILNVTNTDGCTDTAVQFVKINPKVVLYFPTIFSPNGDLLNDVLKLEGVDYVKSYSLTIFNRWGELVFQSNNPKNYWNGYYKNTELPTGAYPYSIEIIDLAGNKISKKGIVQLVR
jgi:gliding motility-associated-like protein